MYIYIMSQYLPTGLLGVLMINALVLEVKAASNSTGSKAQSLELRASFLALRGTRTSTPPQSVTSVA